MTSEQALVGKASPRTIRPRDRGAACEGRSGGGASSSATPPPAERANRKAGQLIWLAEGLPSAPTVSWIAGS